MCTGRSTTRWQLIFEKLFPISPYLGSMGTGIAPQMKYPCFLTLKQDFTEKKKSFLCVCVHIYVVMCHVSTENFLYCFLWMDPCSIFCHFIFWVNKIHLTSLEIFLNDTFPNTSWNDTAPLEVCINATARFSIIE